MKAVEMRNFTPATRTDTGKPPRFSCLVRSVLFTAAAVTLLCSFSLPAFAADSPAYLGSFGPDGTEASDFEDAVPVAVDQATGAVYVGDPSKQALYKFDEEGNPLDFGGGGNEIGGLSFGEFLKSQMSVDPETHVLYVTTGNGLQAFEANGEPHNFIALGTPEISGIGEVSGVTVGENGLIYVSDYFGGHDFEGRIHVYSRSGEPLLEIKTVFHPTELAIDPGGVLYATNSLSSVVKLVPSEVPITGATNYTESGPLNEHPSFSVAVDPTTKFVYVAEVAAVGGTYRVAVYDENGGFVGSLGAEGEEGELSGKPFGVAAGGPGERVYVADTDEASTYSKVKMFDTYRFFIGPPTITATAVTNITSTSAVLRGKINPNTLETAYRFEYGIEDCESVPGACSIASEGTLPPGHNLVPLSSAIGGLSPGTKYYYRIVATNSADVTPGPVRTFMTQNAAFGIQLLDKRAWEQVSPINKFGGVITNGALVQAAQDGSGIVFMSRGAIVEEPEGNRAFEPSANMARRDGAEWQVQDIGPPHTEATGFGVGPEYKLFSPDLGRGVLEPRDETPLSVESSERTPYLRVNSEPPVYRPLVTSKEGFANVPPGTIFSREANGARSPVSFSGGNAELDHLVISSEAPLVAGAQERAVYMWQDGALQPVSELPAGEGGKVVFAKLGSGLISVRHAVSEDGSRVFWSPKEIGGGTLEVPGLYLRDTEAEESIRLDVVQSGAGLGSASPVFMGASADGSQVFFTDGQQLTEDASASGRDLYRCTVGETAGALGCTEIVDLSAPQDGSGENSNVQELSLAMSDDGATLYFVAESVLDAEPNEHNDSAVSGSPNLYLWKDGQGIRFVATLSPGDAPNWGRPGKQVEVPAGHESRQVASGSPDGRYLAFMSELNLTGGESDDPETGEPVEQAFLYDAETEQMVCVSCNPGGGTDPGRLIPASGSEGGGVFPDLQTVWAGRVVGATLPEGTESESTIGYSLYRPRAVLANGRAFFNSVAPLVPVDSNGTWDAYQYEPFGIGTCTPSASGAAVAITEDGCVALLSSGADSEPSVFLDASESGDDAFFLTNARLSVLDTDNIVDVYDARVDGVAALAEPTPECTGEGCRSPGAPPADQTPNSTTFNGPGNVKAKPGKHCKRGQKKVKRHGQVKCVKKRSKHHGKQGASSRAGK